jgi:hypothetical protein
LINPRIVVALGVVGGIVGKLAALLGINNYWN